MVKEKIKESFSKAAVTYDRAADFQRETGLRLIERILLENASLGMVLDTGMGTGRLTQALSQRIGGRVHGCDLAWGMVSFSKNNTRGVITSQADMERLPYKAETFDIVFSNIACQWARDLTEAFSEVRRVLKIGGRFYFSILAKGSLKELHGVLNEFLKIEGFKDFLPSREEIRERFKETGLDFVWIEDTVIKRYYSNCLELLRRVKQSGAGRVSASNLIGMGDRDLFFEMVNRYDANFREGDKVFATYRVLMGCVRKK
ncbi:MAG: methyltransferase domain-containing protein [Candidatus Omnitrophica bacterium]|nr:methyltransferase domain-containing protein [Candidatus Omnitrophota bacterium]